MSRMVSSAGKLAALTGLLVLTPCLYGQTAPDPSIQKLLAEISPDRIADTVKTLAAFQTRGNYSDPAQPKRGIGAARRWIEAQLRACGPRLEVSEDTGKFKGADVVNIVAVLPGVGEPRKRIVVSGHYDSVNLRATGAKAAEAPAPGADDDASGTAVVLELARVMSRYRFNKTIVFIAFAGEEIGLVGSTRYAARAHTSGEAIEAVFNNDIVGSNVVGVVHNDIDGSDDTAAAGSDGDTGNLLRIYSPDPPDSPSRRLARLTQQAAARYVTRLRIDMASLPDRFGRGGDQIPFQKNGFTAIRFTSASENTAVQHTAEDTPEGVSPAFTADVARVNGAAIATLAKPVTSNVR